MAERQTRHEMEAELQVMRFVLILALRIYMSVIDLPDIKMH